MKLFVLFVLFNSVAFAQTRVFLQAGAGYKTVPGIDHPVPRTDSAGHNQFMELAKTFLQRCPEITPTIDKEKADFVVTMNWAPATRFFIGGKLIHKPDQILVTNREGDIIFSGVARSVGGNTDDACKAIMHGLPQQALTQRADPALKTTSDSSVLASGNVATPTEISARSTVREGPAPTDSTSSRPEDLIGVWFTGSPTVRHDGIEIAGVEPNGPAADIEIKPGDIIMAIDGHFVVTIDELRAELRRHELAKPLSIRYRHGRLTSENFLILGSKDVIPER